MHVGRIQGFTRELGKPADWDDARDGICNSLPIQDIVIEGQHCMISAWIPTVQEQLAILAGGTVYLRVVGTAHPPVMVWAEDPPHEDANPYGAPNASI